MARAVVFTLGAGERASFLLVSTNPVEGPGPWALKEVAQSDLCLSKGEAALGAGVPPPEALKQLCISSRKLTQVSSISQNSEYTHMATYTRNGICKNPYFPY